MLVFDLRKAFFSPSFSAATSTTVENPPHSDGDLLMAYVHTAGGGTTHSSASSGWSQATIYTNSGRTSSVWINEADSDSESDLVVTHSSTTQRYIVTWVVPADIVASSSPVDSGGIDSNYNGPPYYASFVGEGTTTVDNTLNFHFAFSQFWRQLYPDANKLHVMVAEYNADTTYGGPCCGVAWDYQTSLGAMQNAEFHYTNGASNGYGISVPIKTNGLDLPRLDSAVTWIEPVHYGTGANNTGQFTGVTLVDASSDLDGEIDGLTAVYEPSTGGEGGMIPLQLIADGIRHINNYAGDLLVQVYSLDTAFDLTPTGKRLAMAVRFVNGYYGTRSASIDDWGLGILLRSGTGASTAYACFKALGSDSPALDQYTTIMIDDGSTITHEIGTFDWSDITGIGILNHSILFGPRMSFGRCAVVSAIPLRGGYSGSELSWESAYIAARGAQLDTVKRLDDAFSTKQDIFFGGSHDFKFKSNGSPLFTPAAPDVLSNVEYQAATGVKITFDPPSSASQIHLTDPLVFGVPGTLSIPSGASPAADWIFSSLISGVGVWDLSDVGAVASGVTVKNSATLTDVDFDWSSGNNSFLAPTGTYAVSISGATAAAIQSKLDKYANNTLHSIEIVSTFAGDISLNFDNMTITTLHYKSSHSASELTAVMVNGSTVGSNTSEDNETVVISNDKTITVTIDVTGAEVTILARGTTTVIDHDENPGTTYTYTYTYSSDTDIDLRVYKPGYEAFWSDTLTLGNADQSVSVSLTPIGASQNL